MNSNRYLSVLPLAAVLAGGAVQPALAYSLTQSSGLFTTTPGAVTFATFDTSTIIATSITGGFLNSGANPGTASNWLFANPLVTINFANLQSYFGLYWGSNDGPINEIEFFNGSSSLGMVSGVANAPNSYWNILAGPGQAFDKVVLKNSFEFDNLAVLRDKGIHVSEPASWALMGIGLPLLIGAARRRT